MTRCKCGMHDTIEMVTGKGEIVLTYSSTLRKPLSDELYLLYQVLFPENCPECHSEETLYDGQDGFILCAMCDYEKHPNE